MRTLRATGILVAFFALTLPLIPVQAVLITANGPAARWLPHWYHRIVCRMFGIRITVKGNVDQTRSLLLVSNHTSWLDIPILSAVAPVSFVAKKEVASWPFVSWLARLQRSVFIDREKRTDVGRATSIMLARLASGDCVVLFPEGTSSDGNRVLSFRTPLFAAAKPPERFGPAGEAGVVVQTAAIVYRNLHGVPLSRSERKQISWYGDMDMLSHAWDFLKAGPLDVVISLGPPQPLDSYEDRKDLARKTEQVVRNHVMRQLRGLAPESKVAIATPVGEIGKSSAVARSSQRRNAGQKAKKWR